MSAQLEWALDHYDIQFNPSRSGEQSIRCPVHDDRQASASLNLDKGLWHCHACGIGGDAIELVKLKEGWDFGTAKRYVESGAGRGDEPLRDMASRRTGVSDGQGYKPRYRRELPARRRRRPHYGA